MTRGLARSPLSPWTRRGTPAPRPCRTRWRLHTLSDLWRRGIAGGDADPALTSTGYRPATGTRPARRPAFRTVRRVRGGAVGVACLWGRVATLRRAQGLLLAPVTGTILRLMTPRTRTLLASLTLLCLSTAAHAEKASAKEPTKPAPTAPAVKAEHQRDAAGLTLSVPAGVHRPSFLMGLTAGDHQPPAATLGMCAPIAGLPSVNAAMWASWADVPVVDAPCACAPDWKPAPADGCFVVKWIEAPAPSAAATPATSAPPVTAK